MMPPACRRIGRAAAFMILLAGIGPGAIADGRTVCASALKRSGSVPSASLAAVPATLTFAA